MSRDKEVENLLALDNVKIIGVKEPSPGECHFIDNKHSHNLITEFCNTFIEANKSFSV